MDERVSQLQIIGFPGHKCKGMDEKPLMSTQYRRDAAGHGMGPTTTSALSLGWRAQRKDRQWPMG